MFGSSLPPVVCRRAHVLFMLFVCVCVRWCPTHITEVVSNTYCVEFLFVLFFLRFVYPVLPVSLDCPFLIAPSVFYNIYWHTTYLLYILIPSPFPSVLNNLWNFRSDDFKLSKSSFWLSWSHHFESFSVATLTWLTVAEYVCHKWPRICPTGRQHFPILSSFMNYYRLCN